MGNYIPAHDNRREDDLHERRLSDEWIECQETSVRVEVFSEFLDSQPIKWQKRSPHCRQMNKVRPELRQKKKKQKKDVYDPIMVSFGPYNHGEPELQRAEEFKYLCLEWCAGQSEEEKYHFYNKVLERIDEFRSCYAEASILDKYDDKALALMMLLDACFIVNFMANCARKEGNNLRDWHKCVGGPASVTFAVRDMLLLENQIPFQVIKLIICLKYEEADGEDLLVIFLSWVLFGKQERKFRFPEEEEEVEPPLHLLEACWRVMVERSYTEANKESPSTHVFNSWWPRLLTRGKKKDENHPANQESPSKHASNSWWPRFLARGKKKDEYAPNFTCLSVTDLKAKGIHFRRGSSHCYKDINFKSHAFHGEIQLPILKVFASTQIFLSNMIAYELSPETKTDLTVLCYTNFMKSLIATPADVKELQDKKILANRLGSHEQVVKVFEEIDTFGLFNFDIFGEVKQRIGEHCDSKAKTWMADLIHTRFESPWTVIALLAATLLLCLTFIQTYFTVHPAN